MKVNDYISRKEVISQLEYCLANFTDYKKALEETLDKVKHTRTISLPKGHGRLGDLSKVYVKLNEAQIEGTEEYSGLGEAKQIVCDTPTIIEADKESE